VIKEIVKRCVGAYEVMAGNSAIEALQLRSVDEILPKT